MNHLYSLAFNKTVKPFCMACAPRGFGLPLLKVPPMSSCGRYQHYKPEHLKAADKWNIQEDREDVLWGAASSCIVSLGMTEGAASSSVPIHPTSETRTPEDEVAHVKQYRQTQTVMKLFCLAMNH